MWAKGSSLMARTPPVTVAEATDKPRQHPSALASRDFHSWLTRSGNKAANSGTM
jgi:hypothetical protein